MLTKEENELMTRVGPGTPAGDLLRRYWWPVGFTEEIVAEGKPRRVRLLGEDLVLFRDGHGRLGLLGLHCSHRGTALDYGRAESAGIRCSYHGWMYDVSGQCVEQPMEPPDSAFKDRVHHLAYRAQDLGGLIFGYLGPEPAPLLPRYDLLVLEDGFRTVEANVDYCNWLQRAENSVDQSHLPVLHASGYPSFAMKRPDINWERTWYGVRVTTSFPGIDTRKVSLWLFPSNNRFTGARVYGRPAHHMNFRVPIDDGETHTYAVTFYPGGDPKTGQKTGLATKGMKRGQPGAYTPVDNGWWGIVEEDKMAAEQQGTIADRTAERLASSDQGILLLRQMIREGIDNVREGIDPVGVVRDPAQNVIIRFDASMAEIGALS
ncbi:MAG TPA: Rieske 2Fe-2S domain-containing protein [Chloroflexota bacterium]|nr:Rieske 2Fe-2S domain-containing protein [Chloroflexota bacterium]